MWLKKNQYFFLLLAGVLSSLILTVMLVTAAAGSDKAYLPLIIRPEKQMVEVRALWVTRYDWTNYASADPGEIDKIVDRSAEAGFNALFFQVRGEGDAYYTPGLEPWARRLSGTLGKDPGWDPLARLITRAHRRGLAVHAYLNVYPLTLNCDVPPDNTQPRHFYHALLEAHGMTGGKANGLMWDSSKEIPCEGYQRVSPASIPFDNHITAVAVDLVQRYDIDGLHLDHIRYAGENSSCDPVSEARFRADCFSSSGYEDWQRRQIDGTVRKIYAQVLQVDPDLWLTAAVWPVYRDKWGWDVSSGYDTYYQDSKAWLAAGDIDGIAPMIYTGSPNCDNPYFWTLERWQILVSDYVRDSHGRMIIPGIGSSFCTNNDFAQIEARIAAGRALGSAGHALYSYKSLLDKGYFDDLARGPYLVPAVLPELPWR